MSLYLFKPSFLSNLICQAPDGWAKKGDLQVAQIKSGAFWGQRYVKRKLLLEQGCASWCENGRGLTFGEKFDSWLLSLAAAADEIGCLYLSALVKSENNALCLFLLLIGCWARGRVVSAIRVSPTWSIFHNQDVLCKPTWSTPTTSLESPTKIHIYIYM